MKQSNINTFDLAFKINWICGFLIFIISIGTSFLLLDKSYVIALSACSLIYLGIIAYYYATKKHKTLISLTTTLLIPTGIIGFTFLKEINSYIPVILLLGAGLTALYWNSKIYLTYVTYSMSFLAISFVLNKAIFLKSGDTVADLSSIFLFTLFSMLVVYMLPRQGMKLVTEIEKKNNESLIQKEEIEKILEDTNIQHKKSLDFNLNIVLNNEKIKQSNDSISSSINAFSNILQNNSLSISNINTQVHSLDETLNSVKSEEQKISDTLNQLIKNLTANKEHVNNLNLVINQITTNNETVNNSYQNSELAFTEIYPLLKKINDISSKTNILAINASIESQRISSDNHSFSVIAAEIRDLAKQSELVVQQINKSLETMSYSLDMTKTSLDHSNTSISQGLISVQYIINFFDTIFSLINNIQLSNSQKESLFNIFIESFAEISNNISTITAIQEEQSAMIEDINCNCLDQTKLIDETYKLCEQ